MTMLRYQIGFALSLVLTCLSFGAVWLHVRSGHAVISHQVLAYTIFALAIVQLVVQLVYFLHFGRESKGRDVVVFTLAASLIVCIAIGSLWIMANLAQNHGLPYNGSVTPQTSED